MPSESPESPESPAAAPADASAPRGRGPGGPARRSFLRGLAGGVAGGVIAGGAAGAAAGYAYRGGAPADPAAAANEAAVNGLLPAVPFHGKYQAGILPAVQRPTAVVSFNVTAQSRAELTELFQTVTDRARFLTAGGTPPLGRHRRAAVRLRRARADGGAGRADGDVRRRRVAVRRPVRARVAAARPPGTDDAFPNDNLDPAQCGGDLILQLARGQRGHRGARAAGHRQEHPRRHAGELADRRLRQPAAARPARCRGT